jgi:hypothetical protein
MQNELFVMTQRIWRSKMPLNENFGQGLDSYHAECGGVEVDFAESLELLRFPQNLPGTVLDSQLCLQLPKIHGEKGGAGSVVASNHQHQLAPSDLYP